MIDFSKFNNIISLTSYFTSNEVCKQAIAESRWADGDVVCPYCGKHRCKEGKGGRYHCTGCNRNFSCLVGTIFENTKLPLVKWFVAMYYISSHKKGVSSHQLSRDLAVTQASAWHMLQKIRLLYAQSDADYFDGTVECVTRCISAERRNGSTSPCAPRIHRVAQRRPRHPSSA